MVFSLFYSHFSVEIAHLIVIPLIEKYHVKTDNAAFVEGLACTSRDLSPILQTAGSYLRCKATLNLKAVHDHVCKICTAQAPLFREIRFVLIALVIVSIFTFGRKMKTKPEVQYFQQFSKETPN